MISLKQEKQKIKNNLNKKAFVLADAFFVKILCMEKNNNYQIIDKYIYVYYNNDEYI